MGTRRQLLLGAGALALPPAWAQPASAVAAAAPDTPLRLVDAVYPPFVNPAGHADGPGLDIEIARQALRRGGHTGEVALQLVPWKRALFLLEHGAADFTTTLAFSSERERFLHYSRPYRAGIRYRFYSRRGAGLQIRHLDELRGHRLALSSGFIYPPAVLATVGREQLEYGRDVGDAVQRVIRGRAELVIASTFAGGWEIHELGLADQLERQPLEYAIERPVHMGFSRASPAAVAALDAMNRGLAALQRDGSLARLEQRYTR